MSIHLLRDRGVPLEHQTFTWKELGGPQVSKLDVDAFTRVRIILMNAVEAEANRFSHALAQGSRELRHVLAVVRRAEHHQQTLISWLLPADQTSLETSIAYEQTGIEVTAAVAEREPDPYLAQVYRFGLLEDFDHMYRFAALMDRVEGKDANTIVQSYTDILGGRPTSIQHRHPTDEVRRPYERAVADPLTKLHALTILAAEQQTRDYYMAVGPTFADPLARRLYAEIASMEEQHVTHYGSIIDPDESMLERWLLHEATEVYNYYGCMACEDHPQVKRIWERFLEYELGHLRVAVDLFESTTGRDAAELLPETLPEPIRYESHRELVRQVMRTEVGLSARGADFVPRDQESEHTRAYRQGLNAEGSPSEQVAAGYTWSPGTELTAELWSRGKAIAGVSCPPEEVTS